MADHTDEVERPAFRPERIEAMVRTVCEIIAAQADSAEEAFTMAFGVFARYTHDIKPECREQMLERLGEALRIVWKAQDDERTRVM